MSRYDGHADERRTPFDEQLAALLARTADASQPSPDLARRVREALTASAAPEARAARRLRFGLPSLGGLAGPALVAALLAVFVVVFSAHGWDGWEGFRFGGAVAPTPQTCDTSELSTTNPPLSANSPDHSVALGQSVTIHHVTITLLRGYADAVSTIVSYQSSLGVDAAAHASHATLTDATGASYPEIEQTQERPVGVLVFPPLPQSQLGAPQRLTLNISNLGISDTSATQVSGTWTIPFTLTPVAGTAIPLSLPAQTHDGVTVTLEALDVAPVGGGLGGLAGGVRARFKISGLDPATTLNTALNYPVVFNPAFPAAAGTGMAPGGASCGDRLTLTLANGQKLLPGFTTLAGANAPEATAVSVYAHSPLTVGASGTIEAQALFYTPATPGHVTFAINTVSISEVRNFASVFVRNAQGPWSFTTALR